MADPEVLLPPTGEIAPTPAGKRPLICEHCGCQLTPVGDVLKMSDAARAHLKHAETAQKLNERISTLETELRDARAKLVELSTVRESRFDLEL